MICKAACYSRRRRPDPVIIERTFKRPGKDDISYTVVLHGPNRATVSGGVLPHPVTITRLLGDGDLNPKTAKNDVVTMGLSLLPADGIGFGNLCPLAIYCKDPCLAHQGQGPTPSVWAPRAAKSVLYYLARDWFLDRLNRELTNFRNAYPDDIEVGVRLNMFSDVRWEDHGIIDAHPRTVFYDYSKLPDRHGWLRPNYRVCFSFDGHNWEDAERILRAGGTVSVVFYDDSPGAKCGKAAHRQELPASFRGWHVIDGGKTDWRPGDPKGVIVGLRLLARTYASRQQAIDSGFAQRLDTSAPLLTVA